MRLWFDYTLNNLGAAKQARWWRGAQLAHYSWRTLHLVAACYLPITLPETE